MLVTETSATGAIVGWANIVFFGGAALLFARELVDPRPRLVIDDRGIFDRTLWVGVIDWHDITDAYVRSAHGHAFICLSLRDPMKYTMRLSPLVHRLVSSNHTLGFAELSLNLAGIDLDAEKLRELIVREAVMRSGHRIGASRGPA